MHSIRLDLMQRLLDATLLLTESQRDLFTRRYLEECSTEEIARATGRSYGAVKQSLANARHRLMQLLVEAGLTPEESAEYLHMLASSALPAQSRRQQEDEE